MDLSRTVSEMMVISVENPHFFHPLVLCSWVSPTNTQRGGAPPPPLRLLWWATTDSSRIHSSIPRSLLIHLPQSFPSPIYAPARLSPPPPPGANPSNTNSGPAGSTQWATPGRRPSAECHSDMPAGAISHRPDERTLWIAERERESEREKRIAAACCSSPSPSGVPWKLHGLDEPVTRTQSQQPRRPHPCFLSMGWKAGKRQACSCHAARKQQHRTRCH